MCIDNERLAEFVSITECTNVVAKFDEQKLIIGNICTGLFNTEIGKKQDFRKNLLCLRHGLEKSDDSQQARKIVEQCAKDFPSKESTKYASNLMLYSFPSAEQRQIQQLKEKNDRLESLRRDEKFSQDMKENDQRTQQRLREINQDYTNQINEINARERANRPVNCVVNGNIVNCN